MGAWKFGRIAAVVTAGVVFVSASGCQRAGTVSHRRLIEHQAMIDFSGLRPVKFIDHLNVRGAVPRSWDELTPVTNSLYTHQQWRSPSSRTGVGIAHIRMPLPMNTGMLLWLAKREYVAKDGRVLAEWKDELGRPWFEAENNKYRVRGYVVVSGFQAWVIYFGHKSGYPPDPAELSLAARAADSILPNLGHGKKRESVASAGRITPENAR